MNLILQALAAPQQANYDERHTEDDGMREKESEPDQGKAFRFVKDDEGDEYGQDGTFIGKGEGGGKVKEDGNERPEAAIIPSAEARRRKLQYKKNKRVGDAQRFAQNHLGVGEVDYGSNLTIANNANHALFLAQERGVPMPSRIVTKEFNVEDGEDPKDLAFYLPSTGDAVGELYINSRQKVWTDPVAAAQEGREKNLFSSDDPRHFIMHEIGELATHQSIGGERFYPMSEEFLRDEEEFRALDRKHIQQTEDIGEWIAAARGSSGPLIGNTFSRLSPFKQQGVTRNSRRKSSLD